MLLLTVTPNPSLDLLFETDSLVWDDANRMDDPRRRAGGQGVNVARAAKSLGAECAAAVLAGGRTGADIVRTLDLEGVASRAAYGAGETRTFVAARERATGRSMLLNARGPRRSDDEVAAFRDVVNSAITELRPRWLACCGSIPAGFPATFYAGAARAARAAGARVVIDCDGDALREGANECDLLVPNEHEAARLAGIDARRHADAHRTAQRLLQQTGARTVAITLGASGAIIARASECWHARPPAVTAGSAVGAGDAFLAGLIIALDAGSALPDALRSAVAAGTGTLLSKGSELLDPGEAARIAGAIELSRLE
jgi:1-phosphofructokinase family hexose kinase